MFDNVALNVVIGLVFIYLLYSLLVTVLSEMISNWLGMRASVLRRSLERMLNDTSKKPEKPAILSSTATTANTENPEDAHETGNIPDTASKELKFADRFYEAPSIKYIARERSKFSIVPLAYRTRKPSYISKENFSQTLIHMFRSSGNGGPDDQQIVSSLENNSLRIEPQTLSHIKNLYLDAKGDVQEFAKNLEKWFNDTMDRANGWYKRKIRIVSLLIGLVIAIFFNLDTIQMAKLLSVDTEARNQLVQLGIAAASDSAFYRRSYRDTVDSAERKDFLDSAYTRLKSDVDKANLVLGLGWDFSSLSEDFILTDSTLNNYMVSCLIDPIPQFNQNIDSLQLIVECEAENAELIKNEINKIKDKRAKLIKLINDSLDVNFIMINKVERLTGADDISIQNEDSAIPNENDSVTVPVNQNVSISGSTATLRIIGKCEGSFWDKTVFILYHGLCPVTSSFWGILFTALLLSLGAPFWFDLLNKIVALRGTGVKPEEKKDEG